MIGRRRVLFPLIAVALVFLWGAILGFGNPFGCTWPDIQDLIRREAKLPDLSLAIESEHQSMTPLEAVIALEIMKRDFYGIRFDPDRDFVGHVSPDSLSVWRYEDKMFISVDEGVAMRELEKPLDMAEYTSGDYSNMFRFAIVHESASHVCVIVVAEERRAGGYEFWHFFRWGFGLGKWMMVTQDRVGYAQ